MKGGTGVKLSKRQEAIAHIVREKGPVTGSAIAEHLDVTRSALRFHKPLSYRQRPIYMIQS